VTIGSNFVNQSKLAMVSHFHIVISFYDAVGMNNVKVIRSVKSPALTISKSEHLGDMALSEVPLKNLPN